MFKLRFLCVAAFPIIASQFVCSQETPGYTYLPNQEVRVDGLRPIKAKSTDPADVLLAALETILHDQDLCCGKNSALADSAQSADPSSLSDISVKLQGKHVLSDGRSISVTVEYLSTSSINPGQIVGSLQARHAILMQWNSHLYVLYGALFDETWYNSGDKTYAVRQLLLLDPRFSDERRSASFHRESEDWGKVQGMLTLSVTLP